MFSNALKSFTSNIGSNYTISPQPVSYSGPWKIFDGKKKSTGQAVSIFVFDRKSLEAPSNASSGLSFRSSSAASSGLKAVHDEIVERLKREASSLARLRHPSILELVEPVEETRSGGLQFATEQVTGSLGSVLKEKNETEGRSGRSGRYVVEDGHGGRKRREVEIDELEIQKGLLQIGKGLEFLHESAGLVHCNLTPEAIFVNGKSDWKLSSLSFATPHSNTEASTASIHSLIAQDPRLPASVQLSLDYASPDLILDSTISSSTDLFSLGLLIVALYNSPHASPLETHNSVSTYKRLLTSPQTTPNQGNEFLSSRPLPQTLKQDLLPRLLTRRPVNRLTARELEENPYFDNILVSTLRFLESLPAKTPKEKSSFMRGLPRVLIQFPKSVLEKKVLPILVEELKDKELIPLLLPNIFVIVENCPGGQRLLSEKVLKRLVSIYFPTGVPNSSDQPPTSSTPTGTRKPPNANNTSLESGLVVILDHLATLIAKTTPKEFKEDVLPLLHLALDSPTYSLQDRALRSLEIALPALDFPTVKHELFPVVANVFAKTNSLGIKIRGLEAFKILCGGTNENESDGLDGGGGKKRGAGAATALDKYTVQEKMVPLLKGIKTKEPGVMMAALDVFKEIGKLCDREVVATDILPILWGMSLGPLLGLEQFQAFMSTIKSLSARIEQEQTRKLEELHASASGAINTASATDFLSFGGLPGANGRASSPGGDAEFERLVLGKNSIGGGATTSGDWGFDNGGWGSPSATLPTVKPQVRNAPAQQQVKAPTFSWSTPSPTTASHNSNSNSGIGMGMASLSLSSSSGTSMGTRSNNNGSAFSSFTPMVPSNNSLASTLNNTLHTNTNNNSTYTNNKPTNNSGTSTGMSFMQPLQPNKPASSSSSSSGFGSMTALRPNTNTSFSPSISSASTSTYNSTATTSSGLDWSTAMKKSGFPQATNTTNNYSTNLSSSSIWGDSPSTTTNATYTSPQRSSSAGMGATNALSSFSPPPPANNNAPHPTILYGQTRMQSSSNMNTGGGLSAFKLPPPPGPGAGAKSTGGYGGQQQGGQQKKSGLDAWDSLL